MAENEQLSILEYLSYPNAVVAAMLRTFDIYGTEIENGKVRNKSKNYRGLIADIVDLINLCDKQMELYKNSNYSDRYYGVSGSEMFNEYKNKKEALEKLIPILKIRFSDNYDKNLFLAQIKKITEQAFPAKSPYRRYSANYADRELRNEINKIYDKRDSQQIVEQIKELESDKDSDFVDLKRQIDPCTRLMKSLEWFANGGDISYGHEYVDKEGNISYSKFFDLTEPYKTPQLYDRLKEVLAAIISHKFETESQLYQRQEENNFFAEIPASSSDFNTVLDYVFDCINEMLGNESFKQAYQYQNLLKMARCYVLAYKREMYRRDNPPVRDDVPIIKLTGQDWGSWDKEF